MIPIAVAVAVVALVAFPASAQEIRAQEEITVERVIIDAHITESDGDPILGLTPADLQVLVDGLPAEIESVDWLPSAVAYSEGLTPEQAEGTEYKVAPKGRLIVFFFQTDFQRARVKGQMRMSTVALEFLDRLEREDRVAVISFDSHLRLWQDFTNDHEKIRRAVRDSIQITEPPEPELVPNPALFTRIDRKAARDAATSERGLVLVGNALNPIPGWKSLVLFGWGLGVYSNRKVVMIPDYARARNALEAARTSVFALDISDADYHSLEVGLSKAAKDTGGFYQKTHIFPRFAMEKLMKTISGRYEIVVKKPAGLDRGTHAVSVTLVEGRPGAKGGTILARKTFKD